MLRHVQSHITFRHILFLSFRAKFVLGCLHRDHAKSDGRARTLSKNRLWLPAGKLFLLFGFQQRLFSKGTENHPSAKQQITSVSLNHTRALWKLERVLFGKAGRDGSEPWEEGFISFSHVSHC